jgi:GntR family transcriptional regulator / MocR family aminotransferase
MPPAGFYAEAPPRPGLLLGYGAIDTLDIEPALLRVRDVLTRFAIPTFVSGPE